MDIFEEEKSYTYKKIRNLKYGENPHQKACLYSNDETVDYSVMSGSEMTFNSILDATCALEIAAEFYDVAACVIVKHENPSAVALAPNLEMAFDKAIDADLISLFGATVAFSLEIKEKLADKLSQMPIKTLIAPSYTQGALEKLKNIRTIKINTNYKDILSLHNEQIKQTLFGALVQEKNTKSFEVSTFKVATKKKPEQKELEDMIFAYKIIKHTKSSSCIIANNLRTIGICAGATNNISSAEIALSKICDSAKDSVLAIDDAIEAKNIIQMAQQNRISAIIQSAGSKKDKEIITFCDKCDISMVTTGIRHYKH